jgi:hypothetical protein
MKLFYIIPILFFIVSCNTQDSTKDINANKVIESLKAISKLGTAEYTLSKVLAGKDNQWYTIGDRRILMLIKAHVIVGIDASLIQFTDVNTREKSIKLQIPAAEIITFDIPPDEIQILDKHVDKFRGSFTTTEINQYEQFGEKKILEQIKELKINYEAEKNAKVFLERILRTAGFQSIEITTQPSKE